MCHNINKAFINNSSIFVSISAVFYTFTFVSTQTLVSTKVSTLVQIFALAFILIFAPVSSLLGQYIYKNQQRVNK